MTHPEEVPPEDVADVIEETAARLRALRKEWRYGDSKLPELIMLAGPETSGYVHLVRRGVRVELAMKLSLLREDWVPGILPHIDPALRSRLLDLMTLLDLDSFHIDGYGDETERWRQTWEGSGIEPEVKTVALLLEASAREMRLRVRPEPEEPEEELSEADLDALLAKLPREMLRQMRLGQAIVLQKENPGWTLKQIASKVGVNRTTLMRWEQFVWVREHTQGQIPPKRGFKSKDKDGRIDIVAIDDEQSPFQDEDSDDQDEADFWAGT